MATDSGSRVVVSSLIAPSGNREMYSEMLEGDRIAEMALHNPQLVKGRTVG